MKPEKLPFLYAILAYVIWGILPVYWILLRAIEPFSVLAHRIIWSAVFLSLYFIFNSDKFSIRKYFLNYLFSALVITINWGVYIWAINNGFVLASSLGYFLAPLLYVAAGCVLLKEQLSAGKLFALLFCSAALFPLLLSSQINTLLIAGLLASSIVAYAYLRKKAGLNGLQGLLLESLIIFPFAVLYLSLKGPAFSDCTYSNLIFLILSGPVTIIPLLLFGKAVKSVPLNNMGFIQYISPVLQFLLGVFYFLEPVSHQKLVSFIFVWIGMTFLLLPKVRIFKFQSKNLLSRKG